MGSKVQNIVLGTLTVCLISLTVIYAVLTQKLDINTNANSKSIYIIKICKKLENSKIAKKYRKNFKKSLTKGNFRAIIDKHSNERARKQRVPKRA